MNKKSFRLFCVKWCIIGSVLSFIFLIVGLSQVQKETSAAFVIKTNHFSFIVDQSPLVSSPMNLTSFLSGKRIVLSHLKPVYFQSGKYWGITPPDTCLPLRQMIIKSKHGKKMDISTRFDNLRLNSVSISPQVKVTIQKEKNDITFKFKDENPNKSPRNLYVSKLALIDTVSIEIEDGAIINENKKIFREISRDTKKIGWLPDETSSNIILKSGAERCSFSFEMEKNMIEDEIFANFTIHNIRFLQQPVEMSALSKESTIMDSSIIRIFDPDRKDIQLREKDYFDVIPNKFTIESIVLKKDGFWLYFHSNLTTLKVGKLNYLGENQILNYLVWWSKDKTLIILIAVFIWLIGIIIQVSPFFAGPKSEDETED